MRSIETSYIILWNLQPDDEHDFMLTDPANRVLLKTKFGQIIVMAP